MRASWIQRLLQSLNDISDLERRLPRMRDSMHHLPWTAHLDGIRAECDKEIRLIVLSAENILESDSHKSRCSALDILARLQADPWPTWTFARQHNNKDQSLRLLDKLTTDVWAWDHELPRFESIIALIPDNVDMLEATTISAAIKSYRECFEHFAAELSCYFSDSILKPAEAASLPWRLLPLMGGKPLLQAIFRHGLGDSTARTDFFGRTLLQVALYYDVYRKQAIDFAPGLLLNHRDCFGLTLLHIACIQGHLECVKQLLKRDTVRLMERDKCGRVPLHYAAASGHQEIVAVFVEKFRSSGGWDSISLLDHEGCTPVALAAAGGHHEIVQVLEQAPLQAMSHGISIFARPVAAQPVATARNDYLLGLTHALDSKLEPWSHLFPPQHQFGRVSYGKLHCTWSILLTLPVGSIPLDSKGRTSVMHQAVCVAKKALPLPTISKDTGEVCIIPGRVRIAVALVLVPINKNFTREKTTLEPI